MEGPGGSDRRGWHSLNWASIRSTLGGTRSWRF